MFPKTAHLRAVFIGCPIRTTANFTVILPNLIHQSKKRDLKV